MCEFSVEEVLITCFTITLTKILDATPGGMLCLPTLNDNCYSKPLLLMGECHVTRYIREQKNKIITTWTINFRVLNFGFLQVYLDLLLPHGWSYKPSVRHDNSRKKKTKFWELDPDNTKSRNSNIHIYAYLYSRYLYYI